MSDSFSRRDWLKTVSAAGVGAMVPLEPIVIPAVAPKAAPLTVATRYAPGDILELYSTSDVFIPPKGRSWMKFSFDSPSPASPSVIIDSVFSSSRTRTLTRSIAPE